MFNNKSNKSENYYDQDGSTAPVGSADYAQWLYGLPSFLRDIVLEDLAARNQQSVQAPIKDLQS